MLVSYFLISILMFLDAGALLMLSKDRYGGDYVTSRSTFDSSRGDQLITFSSERKRMTTVLLNKPKKAGISYTKGKNIELECNIIILNASNLKLFEVLFVFKFEMVIT